MCAAVALLRACMDARVTLPGLRTALSPCCRPAAPVLQTLGQALLRATQLVVQQYTMPQVRRPTAGGNHMCVG